MAMCLMWRDVQSTGVAPAEPIAVSSGLDHGLIRVDFEEGLRGDAMVKSGVTGGAGRRQGRPPAQLWNAIECQLVELCRDLAVQAKRMRQLQEEADELRIVFRRWGSTSPRDSA